MYVYVCNSLMYLHIMRTLCVLLTHYSTSNIALYFGLPSFTYIFLVVVFVIITFYA